MQIDLTSRKSALTQFLAGGVLALSLFSTLAFGAMLFRGAEKLELDKQDVSNFVENGAGESAGLSKIVEKLVGHEGTWPLDEAPEETEEPMDESEEPSSPLPYPTEFNSLGGEIVHKTYSYTETSTTVTLPGGGMLRNSTEFDTEALLSEASKNVEFSIEIDSSEP